MKPIIGATYRHYKSGLYMVTGFAIEEGTGKELVLYASIKDAVQFAQSVDRFTDRAQDPVDGSSVPRFTLEIPAQPTIGIPAVGYLWTNIENGAQMLTKLDEPFEDRDMPHTKREAVVRLSDAFTKVQLERVQSLSHQLKNTM